MGVKTPNKYASLKFLTWLRENNFISKSGLEYSEEETVSLYFERAQNLADKEVLKRNKFERATPEIIDQRVRAIQQWRKETPQETEERERTEYRKKHAEEIKRYEQTRPNYSRTAN